MVWGQLGTHGGLGPAESPAELLRGVGVKKPTRVGRIAPLDFKIHVS